MSYYKKPGGKYRDRPLFSDRDGYPAIEAAIRWLAQVPCSAETPGVQRDVATDEVIMHARAWVATADRTARMIAALDNGNA